jgi:ABC-2 type transport system permease protein
VSTSSFVSVALGVARRTLHNVFTTPSLLLPSLMFPLLNFTAFAAGLSSLTRIEAFDYEPGYTAFQFVFVLLQSAVFGGVFTAFGIARDFEYGFARRLLVAAPHRSALVAGYALAAIVRWLFVAAIVTVVALAAGMQIGGDGVDVAALYVLALLAHMAGMLWAAGVALRFRTVQAGPLMQMPVFIVLFLAPVYVPLALLHGWIAAVAAVNPITPVLEAGRSLLAGDPDEVALAFAVAASLVLALGIWAIRGLRRAEAAG